MRETYGNRRRLPLVNTTKLITTGPGRLPCGAAHVPLSPWPQGKRPGLAS